MSLNGLEAPNIKEAHKIALSEPDGWFLLKYTSRDEMELLGRGNCGILDMRSAIASHKDASPLYGFLRFRRKNVLIKFVPEECSRLVQARVTVHFNAVTEHFSPYDTTFSITSPKGLHDTALSRACSLHTTSSSTSSTNSLRMRQLTEIAEEEEGRGKRDSKVSELSDEVSRTAKAFSISESSAAPSSKDPASSSSSSETQPWTTCTANSSVSQKSSDVRPDKSTSNDLSTAIRTSKDNFVHSPSISSGRCKIRLGPRPSHDVVGRPRTLANSSNRPISTLPAGLKSFAKENRLEKEVCRPSDSEKRSIPPNSPPPTATSSMVVTDIIIRPHSSSERPVTSSGFSFRSIPSPTILGTSKTYDIDSARARLLKAQEIRKKKIEFAEALDPSLVQVNTKLLESASSLSTNSSAGCELSLVTPKSTPKLVNTELKNETVTTTKIQKSDSNPNDSTDFTTGYHWAFHDVEPTRAFSIDESIKNRILVVNSNTSSSSESIISSLSVTKTEYVNMLDTDDSKCDSKLTESQKSKHLPTIYEPVKVNSLNLIEHEGDSPEDKENLLIFEEEKIETNSDTTEEKRHISSLRSSEESDFSGQIEVSETSSRSMEHILEKTSNTCSNEKSNHIILQSKSSLQSQSSAPQTPDKEKLAELITPKNLNLKENLEPGFTIKNSDITGADQKILSKFNDKRADAKPEDQESVEIEYNFSSDDEFMDELQSAIIEDAKPVSVAKSTINPNSTSPNSKEGDIMPLALCRTSSNTLSTNQNSNLKLVASTRSDNSRSVSASAVISSGSSMPNLKMVKKISLGTGISQRIKALERLSTLAPEDNTLSGTTAGVPTFFAVRKTTVRSSLKSKSKSDRLNSFDRTNLPHQNDLTLTLSTTQNVKNKSSKTKSSQTPESVSITAQLIDPSQNLLKLSAVSKVHSDYNTLNLQESQSNIDRHKNMLRGENTTVESSEKSTEKKLKNVAQNISKGRRSSLTVLRGFFNERRHSVSENTCSTSLDTLNQSSAQKSQSKTSCSYPSKSHKRNLSNKSQRSSNGRDTVNFSLLSANSVTTCDEMNEVKSSRTSRVFNMISSSISARRKSLSQANSSTVPKIKEPGAFENLVSSKSTNIPNYSLKNCKIIGDVNIQYPDSLLWKRRTILLDKNGFLLLTPIMSLYPYDIAKDTQNFNTIRRFHMSEFKIPYVPDVEIEELPNSIILDLFEGQILQIACQDRPTQKQILNTLQDVHHHWSANLQRSLPVN